MSANVGGRVLSLSERRRQVEALRESTRAAGETVLGFYGSGDPEKGWAHVWWASQVETVQVRLRRPQRGELTDLGGPIDRVLTAAGWDDQGWFHKVGGCGLAYLPPGAP